MPRVTYKMNNGRTMTHSFGSVQFLSANYNDCIKPIAAVGDVNQDGHPDFVLAAPNAPGATGSPGSGVIYLIYGRSEENPFPSTYQLSSLGSPGNTDGVKIYGDDKYYSAGATVSGAGDVNGDGIDDILIGNPQANIASGMVYLVYGRSQANPFAPTFKLSSLTSSTNKDGVIFYGKKNTSYLAGASLSGIGDVNDDGIDDFLIGAPHMTYPGGAYLIYGRPQSNPFPASFQLSSLGSDNNTDGVVFYGNPNSAISMAGTAVTALGDVNDDGHPDFAIGNSQDGNSYDAGITYVLYGRSSTNPFSPIFQLNSLGQTGNTDGVAFYGKNQNDLSSTSISGTGDVNGDKIPDFVIGAPGVNMDFYTGRGSQGAAYLIYGRSPANPFPPSFQLGSLGNEGNKDGVVIFGATNAYSMAGWSVSGAGDFNGDGARDIVIGAPTGTFLRNTTGMSYVLYGKKDTIDSFPPSFYLDNIRQTIILPQDNFNLNATDTTGVEFNGASVDVVLGASVAGVGDVTGDGYSDVLMAAPYATNKGQCATYLVYGQPTTTTTAQISTTVKTMQPLARNEEGFLLPVTHASNTYQLPVQVMLGASCYNSSYTAGELPAPYSLMLNSENSAAPIHWYQAAQRTRDPLTNNWIYEVHAAQGEQWLGSIQLLGKPEFCRSPDGKRHNIVGLTGIFAGQDHEFEPMNTENICTVLPPEPETFSNRAANSITQGIIAGSTPFIRTVLESAGLSQGVAYAASQATYYTSLFVMYYSHYYAKANETKEVEDSNYIAAMQAATTTGLVIGLNAMEAGAHYAEKKCEAQQWTKTAGLFSFARKALQVVSFAPQVVNAVNQPDLTSSARVIGESLGLMALGVGAKRMTEIAGEGLTKGLGLSKAEY